MKPPIVAHHKLWLEVDALREQPTCWTPACSCGWRGLPVVERWFVPGDFSSLPEAFRTVAERFGENQLLADAIYGREDQASVQLLHHVSYDPQGDESAALSSFTRESEAFVASYLSGSAAAQSVKAAADNAVAVRARQEIWRTVPPPAKPALIPEAQELLKRLFK